MVKQVLLLLLLMQTKANQIETCEKGGKLNMTFVVNTLIQVVSSHGPNVKSQQESIEEVNTSTKKTWHAIQNITDILGLLLGKLDQIQEYQEQLQRKQEKLQNQLQPDVTFMKNRLAKITCDDGARCYSGSCYITDVIKRTWEEARNNCRTKGSDLVSIETAGENEFLKTTMSEYSTLLAAERRKNKWFGFWTSGSDEDEEGTWIWKATGFHFVFQNWRKGYPDNRNKRQHHMVFMVNQSLWDDENGSAKRFSFCEKMLAC